jgi:hypothetical protein
MAHGIRLVTDRPVADREPLSAEEAFDREYDALMGELGESPLPGAMYAYEVVGRRRPSIKVATLDAGRLRPAGELDVERLAEIIHENGVRLTAVGTFVRPILCRHSPFATCPYRADHVAEAAALAPPLAARGSPADESRLREALETALSVVLHDQADPECSGEPPYDATHEQAIALTDAVLRAPIVRAALAQPAVPVAGAETCNHFPGQTECEWCRAAHPEDDGLDARTAAMQKVVDRLIELNRVATWSALGRPEVAPLRDALDEYARLADTEPRP